MKMKLIELTSMPIEEYHNGLRRVRLVGHGQPFVYENAVISSEPLVDTDLLIPTQRYVLTSIMQRTRQLYELLLREQVDLLELTTAWQLKLLMDDNTLRIFHLTPPLIEVTLNQSYEQIWLLADGMHRVALARELNYPISITLIKGASHPYYARPLCSWNEVLRLDTIPEGFKKKAYLEKDYKDLFRNYNEVFPGIQLPRNEYKMREERIYAG
jgi:hypothetical protein